jgi:hypothetical protein
MISHLQIYPLKNPPDVIYIQIVNTLAAISALEEIPYDRRKE